MPKKKQLENQLEPENIETPIVPQPEQPLSTEAFNYIKIQGRLDIIDNKLNNLLESQNTDNDKSNQKWYKSFGIWLCIILVLLMLYGIYLFYMSEQGKKIVLPF